MRAILFAGVLSALSLPHVFAEPTVLVSSPGGEGTFADGAAWPTTGGFTFEIGHFPAGFDPAKDPRATWSSAWTALRPTGVSGAVTSWFRDGTSTLFSVVGTGASAEPGTPYYVWGSNSRRPRQGTEWVLLTNPAWRVAVRGAARLPDLYTTTDPGTRAVYGELAQGGKELRSAAPFDGELRLLGQVADFSVVAGESATVAVKAAGSGFAYQWYVGRKGDTTRPVAGARQPTYLIGSVQRAASFWVRVTDGVNTIESETITVTATDAGAGVVATQTVAAARHEGEESVTIVAEISSGGATGELNFAALLPSGWHVVGSESSAARRPAAGAAELIEWSWPSVPAGVVTLRYTIAAPAGGADETGLTALVTVVREGVTSSHLVQPEPLSLRASGLPTSTP